jgi:hypothetical protein
MAARLLFGGAGLLLVFGCSDSKETPAVGSVVSTSSTTAAAAPTVAAGPTVPGETTTIVAGTLAPVDGAALLQQAVAATGSGYHFNQTVTVDGAVVLTADGDRLTDGARMAITGAGGVLSYIINADGSWVMPEGGDWEVLDSPPADVDPIAALAAPTSVAVASNDGTTVQLAVTVPASSLGITAEGDAAVQVSVVGGAFTNIAYNTTLADGRSAAVNTVIGPAVDPSPVVAPV